MPEIEYLKYYRARAKLRRGPGWDVRPEAEPLDGKEMVFWASGKFSRRDRAQYAGEHRMVIMEPNEIGWIASGDLCDIEGPVPKPENWPPPCPT